MNIFRNLTLPYYMNIINSVFLLIQKTVAFVLNQMVQLWWFFKPCDISIFDSEVLNLECYAGPLDLGQAGYQKHPLPPQKALSFIWIDLQVQTLTTRITETWPQDKKGLVRTKTSESDNTQEYCHQLNKGNRDSRSDTPGKVPSVIHCTRKSAVRVAFQIGPKPVQRPLPGVVLKTSFRQLLQSLHQKEMSRDLTAEVLQKLFWKPRGPDTAMIAKHEKGSNLYLEDRRKTMWH